jgi:hypothetical protein
MTTSPSASLEMRRIDATALDITPFVPRFVWTESLILGGFYWTMEFKAIQWKEWDDLMMGREGRTVQFRFRSEEEGGAQSTEWRTAVVDKSRAAFSQDISMIGNVKGADRALLMAQVARTRVFKQRTAAEVLRIIATEHGLLPDIEDTRGVRDWFQVREDDWTFARRLARGLSTDSGRGDAYLWVDETTLRFGAPPMSELSARRYDMNSVESRVDGYAVAYHGREADRAGAATLRGVGFNFRTKLPVTFTLDGGTAQTHPSLARRVPRAMEDGLRVFPAIEQTAPRVEEVVRSRWGRHASRYLAMRVRTRPDLSLRPNVVVSMESNMGERRETPFMGRYVVVEVQHVLTRGTLETNFVAYRREAQEGDAQPTGANADVAGTRDQFQVAGINPTTIVVAQEI